MSDVDVSDTVAYKIVDQIVGHIFPDYDFDDRDFVKVFRIYSGLGGRWQDMVQGDIRSFRKLIKILKIYFKIRKNPKKYGF